MVKIRNAYKVSAQKPEGKRPVATTWRRWEDNIRMDLREIGWEVWTERIWLRIRSNGGLL
jgi:hypothetical protein